MTEPQFRLDGDGDHRPVVNASGEIDLANVDQFQDVMTKAASSADTITVDLSHVSYCDSAAVRALFSVAASTKLHLIIRSSGPIKTLLSVSGLDRVATVTTADE
ncbi:MAG: STAS domain-containing protein [Mycobacterium sp.]